MATPRIVRTFAWTGVITLALVLGCYGQSVKPNEVIKWDDYTFKFGPSAQMAQVLQGDKVVGSILMMNGSLQVMPPKRISDNLVEIIPKEPLAPGQYVLGGPPTVGVYDFGVEASKAN